jgi:hypothetical protein
LIRTPGRWRVAGVTFGIRKPKTTGRVGRKNGLNRDERLSSHHEIPIKVTAWVDKDVAPLVLALNEFEDVVTLDSCQGNEEQLGHVFFCNRGDARTAALFAANFAATLASHDDVADYYLTAEWKPGADEPIFRLACPARHIDGLARVLSEVS